MFVHSFHLRSQEDTYEKMFPVPRHFESNSEKEFVDSLSEICEFAFHFGYYYFNVGVQRDLLLIRGSKPVGITACYFSENRRAAHSHEKNEWKYLSLSLSTGEWRGLPRMRPPHSWRNLFPPKQRSVLGKKKRSGNSQGCWFLSHWPLDPLSHTFPQQVGEVTAMECLCGFPPHKHAISVARQRRMPHSLFRERFRCWCLFRLP